jgi:hypothetical protein
MRIRAGYDIAFAVTQPTSMILMLTVHPSRAKDVLTSQKLLTEPNLPLRDYRDAFGHVCTRVLVPAGTVRFSGTLDILDSGRADEVSVHARQHPVHELPDDILIYYWAAGIATLKSFRIWRGEPLPIPNRDGTECRRSASLFTTTSNLVTLSPVMTELRQMLTMKWSVCVVTLRTLLWPCAAV